MRFDESMPSTNTPIKENATVEKPHFVQENEPFTKEVKQNGGN